MSKTASGVLLSILDLDRTSPVPLYQQVCARIRDAVLADVLAPGTRLPSTRTLARELSISRNTVMTAFDQLLAEGVLVGRPGAGTFVAVPAEHERRPRTEVADRLTSRHARAGEPGDDDPPETPTFAVGAPATDRFPLRRWRELTSRRLRRSGPRLAREVAPCGVAALRSAIARHVGAYRGVRCDPRQVIVTSSCQQSLLLVAQALLEPGDRVWFEEPGYFLARELLAMRGADVVPVPVVEGGIPVDAARALAPEAKLVYVTPSNQFPLGGSLDLARRRDLLEWARDDDGWIVEDDYDSEFRFDGEPLPSLQGLDDAGRVLYAGTFSKALSPAVGVAYLILPEDLVDSFSRLKSLVDPHPHLLPQMVLADLIDGGDFAAHVRRMRDLYRARADVLLDELGQRIGDTLRVERPTGGLHLVGRLPSTWDDEAIAREAMSRGLRPVPLSRTYATPPTETGLLLGFAGNDSTALRRGAAVLAQLLDHGKV